MELIIDIPEEKYKDIVNMAEEILDASTFCSPRYLYKAVLNGTPLPKGHGRLMDYGYVVNAIDDWINSGEYEYSNATVYLRNRIRNALTIIEADGGDAE